MALVNSKLILAYLHVIRTNFMKKSIATRQCINGLTMRLMNLALFFLWKFSKEKSRKVPDENNKNKRQQLRIYLQLKTKLQIESQSKSNRFLLPRLSPVRLRNLFSDSFGKRSYKSRSSDALHVVG
jgi:hypothetical protein